MSLRHHVIPFAAADVLVILAHQFRILPEQRTRALGQVVGGGPSLHGIQMVHSGRHIQLVDDGAGLDRIQHQLKVGVALPGRQAGAYLVGALGQGLIVGGDAFRFVVVGQAVSIRRQQLRLAAAVEFGVQRDDFGDLGRVGRTEFALRPQAQVVWQTFGWPRRRIPCIAQEKFDRHFHRLQVADIDDPHAPGVVLPRQMHLFPDLWYRRDIDPLVRTRAADIVEVVVHPGAAGPLAFFSCRQAPDIAPVVVAPQQHYVVRHAHALFVVFLDFLVQRPCLRYLGHVGIDFLGDDIALVGNDAFQQRHVGFLRHRLIAVAAHADGDHLFVVARVAQTLAPEVLQHAFVALVVPWPSTLALPFLLRAHHRFMVRGADDDAVFIGQFAIQLVVVEEG